MLNTMLSFFGILVLIPHLFALDDPYTDYSQLNLPNGAFGPDSVALDPNGGGPYVGVSDGRILKWNGTEFVDFGYLSPNRYFLCINYVLLVTRYHLSLPYVVTV